MTTQQTPPRGFGSDNHSGIHPTILEAIVEANGGHSPSYGTDQISREVGQAFREALGSAAHAFFVFNGTAANVLCLESLVRPHQSILCGDTSHLWLDECGAPERHIGAKLIPVTTHQGKLRPEDLEAHILRAGDQHFLATHRLSRSMQPHTRAATTTMPAPLEAPTRRRRPTRRTMGASPSRARRSCAPRLPTETLSPAHGPIHTSS